MLQMIMTQASKACPNMTLSAKRSSGERTYLVVISDLWFLDRAVRQHL